MKKMIAHILKGREKQITKDEKVLQPLPHKDFRFANPFIVLHHKVAEYVQPGSELRIMPHPHRGFAPVTFMIQGEGCHMDSAGHEGLLGAGEVQWMFAGKGLLHSEGPSRNMLEKGGMHEFVQLWVNVPAKDKWNEPSYQSVKVADMPLVLEQEGVHLQLASGEFDGKTGPIQTFTPITSFFGTIKKGNRIQISATEGYWSLLYLIKGNINIDMESVEAHQLVVFEKENDDIIVCAEEDATILFLSAKPIEEPIAAKENFVMNNMDEIDQAMADAAAGKFGTLSY